MFFVANFILIWILICVRFHLIGSLDTPAKFIHIPKAGGTSIEVLLTSYDIRVGWLAFDAYYKPEIIDGNNRAYEVLLSDPKCSDEDQRFNKHPYYHISCGYCTPHHRIPKEFVPYSFTVVREPKSRLISEFCYLLSNDYLHTDPMLRSLNMTNFNVHSCNQSQICNMFNEYLSFILIQYENNKTNIQDCHFIPQWFYAQHAAHIIPLSSVGSKNFTNFLSNFFNKTIQHSKIQSRHMTCKYPKIKQIKFNSCVNSANRNIFNRYSRIDYKHLSKYF